MASLPDIDAATVRTMETESPRAIDVILVEDNPDDALLVRRRLGREAGFRIRHAESLDDALPHVHVNGTPACVLLDLSLPDADGLEGLERLRAYAPEVPIVVLTGVDDERVGLQALTAGAQDYLVKGKIAGDSVARAIRYAVERERTEATLAEARARFRRTFEHSPLGIAIVGGDGGDAWRIIDVNAALAEIVGRSPDQLTGVCIDDLTHWQDRSAQRTALNAVHAGAVERYGEARRLIRADGQTVVCSMTASGVRDAAGKLLYLIVLVEDITEREARREALREAHAALDGALLGIALVGLDGRMRAVNRYYAEALRYSPQAMIGMADDATVHPLDRHILAAAVAQTLRGEQSSAEVRSLRGDGSTFEGDLLLVPNVGSDGELKGYHHFMRDITERKAAQRSAEASEGRYRRIVETANDGVWTVDENGLTTLVNDQMAGMLGYSAAELIGRPFDDFVVTAHDGDRRSPLHRARAGVADRGDYRLQRSDGQELWGLVSSTPLWEDGRFTGVLSMVTDISDRKRAEEQLATLALTDSLTDLPNRALFNDRLRHALVAATRRKRLVGVLFVDLDRFKAINDGYGHALGDELLQAVAPRFAAAIRGGDTLARFGGDEFVVVCEDLTHEWEAIALANRLLESLEVPVELSTGSYAVTASIGVAVSCGDGATAEDLVRDADTAMYQAKELGGNRHDVFDVAMRQRLLTEIELEHDLRHALDTDELFLEYQPKVDLPDENVVGLEALVRWRHPRRGVLGPDEFIPLAERTGLIVDMGRWVVDAACRQVAEWTARDAAPWARVAVNVSARCLDQPDFVEMVRALVESHGVSAHRLELEITETVLFEQDPDVTAATMRALDNLGIRVVLDDFGTGYSSLSYLSRFPLSGIKLDRAFISEFEPADRSTRSIVEAVTAMAQSLGLTMVGEGVETIDQAALLADLGCDFAQGYLFARPLDAADVPSWIATRTKRLAGMASASAVQDESWVTLGDAASALGVSASTLRRWADDGRVAVQRTPGGHRRFAVEDLKRVAPATHTARLDLGGGERPPLPGLAAILDARGERLVQAVTKRLYQYTAGGWFASERARRPLRQWLGVLGRACVSGDYEPAKEATDVLARRAEIGGASLFECSLFVERFTAAMVQVLRADAGAEDADVLAAQRVGLSVRHAVLAGR